MKLSAAKVAKIAAEAALDEVVFEGIDDRQRDTIIAHVEKTSEKRLRAELRPIIAQEIHDEVFAAGKAAGREEHEKEVKYAAPTAQEVGDFENYVHEVEVDCFAQSVTASNAADEIEKKKEALSSKRVRFLWAFPLVLSVLGANAVMLGVWPAALLMGVLGIVTIIAKEIRNDTEQEGLIKQVTPLRDMANEYRILVERAKLFRMVRGKEARTSESLRSFMQSLVGDKERLDVRHKPRIDVVDDARQAARVRIATDTVQAGDFDARLADRLAEAEDEAVAEEAKSKA